jgi:hypothetical protein
MEEDCRELRIILFYLFVLETVLCPLPRQVTTLTVKTERWPYNNKHVAANRVSGIKHLHAIRARSISSTPRISLREKDRVLRRHYTVAAVALVFIDCQPVSPIPC